MYAAKLWKISARGCETSYKSKEIIQISVKTDIKIFDENLVVVHKMKEVLTLDRPAYIAFWIYQRH